MAIDVMVDLETLGTKPGCAILSIGACVFGPDGVGQAFNDQFYRVVDMDALVGDIDPKTLKWWWNQGEEARKEFLNADAVSHLQMLYDFEEWYWSHTRDGGGRIWSHGATFDIPILEYAYDHRGSPVGEYNRAPWSYRDPRDTRTILGYTNFKVEDFQIAGVKHNALHDAVAQARAMVAAHYRLGIWKKPVLEDESAGTRKVWAATDPDVGYSEVDDNTYGDD